VPRENDTYDAEKDQIITDLGQVEGTMLHVAIRSYAGAPPRVQIYAVGANGKVYVPRRYAVEDAYKLGTFLAKHLGDT
jgi:hypothetical protein